MKATKEILLLDRHRIIFLLSGKCGSSAVRRMAINTLNYGKNLTYLQPDQVKEYPGYYKIMLVRNPYDRMVSLYKDKVKDHLRPHFRQLGIRQESSFTEFMRIIMDIPDEDPRADSHFWCQTIFYYDVMPNLIVKLEGLQEQWFVLGLPALKHEHVSKDKTPYQEFYDDEAQVLVRERYSKDLLILDYNYDNNS